MTLGQNTANTTNPLGTNAPDLTGMTKAQLLNYANENDISGVSASMRKADIYNAIVGDSNA